MNQSIASQILDLQDEFSQNQKYTQLIKEYRESSDYFLKAVDSMSKEQRDAVFSYLGYLSEAHLSLLEFALSR